MKSPRHIEPSRRRNVALGLTLLAAISGIIVSCAKASESGGPCDSAPCGAPCGADKPACPRGTFCGNDSKCTAICLTDGDCPKSTTCDAVTGNCTAFGSGVTIVNPAETPGASGSSSTSTVGGIDPNANGGAQKIDYAALQAQIQLACTGWASELESVPGGTLEFVIDTSLSMTQKKTASNTWDTRGGTGDSKWKITHDALVTAIAQLPDSAWAGLVFFPNHAVVSQTFTTEQNPSVCFTPNNGTIAALDATHRAALKTALDNQQADGNTPTYEAYFYGVTMMQKVSAAAPGEKFVVLITDGLPTFGKGCLGNGLENVNNIIPTDPIIQLVSDAAAVGIKTFIIGSPGSERGIGPQGVGTVDARPWLSKAARAGQTAKAGCDDSGSPHFCHIDMTQATDFSAALQAGLGGIANELAANCQYQLPNPPTPGQSVDVGQLSVFVTDATGTYHIEPSAQASCTEGWQFINNVIQLCPDTCKRAQSDVSSRVQILAGCVTAVDNTIPNTTLL